MMPLFPRTTLPALLLAGLCALPALTCEAADKTSASVNGWPQVFADDFNSASAERWEPSDANAWKTVDIKGNYVYSQFQASKVKTPVRSPFNRSMIKDLNVGSFQIDVKLQSTGRDYGHRDLCVFFGYQDPAHMYYVHLGKKADDHANQIFIVNGEPRKKISTVSTDGTNWDDEWHHVRVLRDVESGRIDIFFDDMQTPVMQATDKTFKNGQIGLGSFDDTGNFDDVVVFADKQPSATHNVAPKGYTALFNGKDLSGWKGLVGNPKSRKEMAPEKLAEEQKSADEKMRAHWKVEDGALVFDGKGDSLCTAKDYGDFELLVDWKILKAGDSGIYLRGWPQVQIWDPDEPSYKKHGADKGSGSLWNNAKHERFPLVRADNPVGEWNTFKIRMVGDKVSVWLNDKLVTDNVVMEIYTDKDKPIDATGQIELQNHGNTLYFRNIYVKDLSHPEPEPVPAPEVAMSPTPTASCPVPATSDCCPEENRSRLRRLFGRLRNDNDRCCGQ
ncbi:MAG: DUF1080 domain-containing protein [Planctomycetaceae bacterium]